MAVVQISRIQIRRGKANTGTGLPQLASGELAWALDTQELYIGNGSVAEGAPAVGNTKVITELDLGVNGNILNLLQYIYKISNTGIQTGPTSNTPVTRFIQARLDDQVNLNDFGVVGDGIADDTAAIQRAIFQLFLNSNTTKASEDTFAAVQNRVVLTLPPGKYKTTAPLYIPSYATLEGAGPNKTIIEHSGTGPIVHFINDTSTQQSIVTLNNIPRPTYQYLEQPKGISISGMSFHTASASAVGLQLDAVRDSTFTDITIKGSWVGLATPANRGIWMQSSTVSATCERNVFKNVNIEGFYYAVYGEGDINNNSFDNMYITGTLDGFRLATSSSQIYGPRHTHINNVRFYNIKQHAAIISSGLGNTISNVQLDNVGNNGGSHLTAEFVQIFIGSEGNTVQNVSSDRLYGQLNFPVPSGDNELALRGIPYLPDVTGVGTYKSYSPLKANIHQITGFTEAFRLPLRRASGQLTQGGCSPNGTITYSIDYVYKTTGSTDYTRHGTLTVVANVSDFNGSIQYADEYDYVGPSLTFVDNLGNEISYDSALTFKAIFLDQIGDEYIGAGGQIPSTMAIMYTDQLPDDGGQLTYSYTANFFL